MEYIVYHVQCTQFDQYEIIHEVNRYIKCQGVQLQHKPHFLPQKRRTPLPGQEQTTRTMWATEETYLKSLGWREKCTLQALFLFLNQLTGIRFCP